MESVPPAQQKHRVTIITTRRLPSSSSRAARRGRPMELFRTLSRRPHRRPRKTAPSPRISPLANPTRKGAGACQPRRCCHHRPIINTARPKNAFYRHRQHRPLQLHDQHKPPPTDPDRDPHNARRPAHISLSNAPQRQLERRRRIRHLRRRVHLLDDLPARHAHARQACAEHIRRCSAHYQGVLQDLQPVEGWKDAERV